MRLDKFLKTSCLFKTRSSASKAIENGNVLINEKKTKSSLNVKLDDILTVVTPLKISRYKIINILEKNVTKKEAKDMYQLIGEEKIEI